MRLRGRAMKPSVDATSRPRGQVIAILIPRHWVELRSRGGSDRTPRRTSSRGTRREPGRRVGLLRREHAGPWRRLPRERLRRGHQRAADPLAARRRRHEQVVQDPEALHRAGRERRIKLREAEQLTARAPRRRRPTRPRRGAPPGTARALEVARVSVEAAIAVEQRRQTLRDRRWSPCVSWWGRLVHGQRMLAHGCGAGAVRFFVSLLLDARTAVVHRREPVLHPALMGCTIVWKPASTAALSAYYYLRLLQAAGLPDGAINLVYGSGATIGAPRSQARTSPGSTSPGRRGLQRNVGDGRQERGGRRLPRVPASRRRDGGRTSSSRIPPRTPRRSRRRSCAGRSSTRDRSARPVAAVHPLQPLAAR